MSNFFRGVLGSGIGLFLFSVLLALPWAVRATAQSASPSVTQANGAARREMTAVRLEDGERIEIDGVFDEPVWQRALPARDFIQQDPNFGAAATEPTEVRIVYNRESLYMGVTNFDSEPDGMIGFQRRRDEFLGADDRFMWTMDTYLDGRSGYFFEMNPSGLMADALMGASGQNNRQWDGIWTAKVRRTTIGWLIEIEIPFRTLNFDPNAEAWGINFQRTVRRKSEETLWMGHARNQGLRRMTNAGLLRGIREVSQGKGLDVKPYLLGTAFQRSAGAEPDNPVTWQLKPGVDLFYSPTPRIRANFTLNTDFAQTEVDDRQVNLTRFSLFFEEKRDFFLEGASFFDFRSTADFNQETRVFPFFSRRIGLSARREPQKIDFGGKLTGQVGQQDVGLLHVRTGEENGSPGEDFTVARVKRRILSQSFIGGLMTRRAARGEGGAVPVSAVEDAYTFGLDTLLSTRFFLGSQNLEVGGFLLGASVQEGAEGGRYSYGMDLGFPNDPWTGEFSFREVQKNFDPAVGFVSRSAYRRYNPQLSYSLRPRGHRWIRSFSFGALTDFQTDLENRLLTRLLELKLLEVQGHSGDTFSITVTPSYERLEERFEIFDDLVNGQRVELPAGGEYRFTRWALHGQTANRRLLALRTDLELGNYFSGTRQRYEVGLTLRARPGVIIYSEAEWNRFELAQGRFQTRLYRVTPELQFSPWIAFVNSFQYDNESRVLGWQARFRWIIQPGNDFYLVYNHNWRDDGRHGFETQDRRASSKFIYTHRF